MLFSVTLLSLVFVCFLKTEQQVSFSLIFPRNFFQTPPACIFVCDLKSSFYWDKFWKQVTQLGNVSMQNMVHNSQKWLKIDVFRWKIPLVFQTLFSIWWIFLNNKNMCVLLQLYKFFHKNICTLIKFQTVVSRTDTSKGDIWWKNNPMKQRGSGTSFPCNKS